MLVGRQREVSAIDGLLADARAGRSGVLVMRGEPGIGKSALLAAAAERATDMRVLEIRAFESEASLPFAGLSQLLAAVTTELGELPQAQRRALMTALGLEAPGPVDRFTAYAATLSLLAAVAETRSLAVLVDDAHWLDVDSAEALTFAARRLGDEGIAMLLTSRDEVSERLEATGLAELSLSGFDLSETKALVDGVTEHDVPVALAQRLMELTAGNPLALSELARALTARQLTGAEPLDRRVPIGAAAADAFGRQIARLPEETQRALVVVAAADGVSTVTLGRALRTLGLSWEALRPAEAAGLATIEDHVLDLRHPLVRSAAYHRAQEPFRRDAHSALAEALDRPGDRARRVWHLAAATLEADETIAAELEAVGADARARGAPASAGSALAAAAELTPALRARARRLLQAAQDLYLAGTPDRPGALLDEALAAAGDDPLLRARIQHARVRGDMMLGWPQLQQRRLREEAERVRGMDEDQATAMLIDACVLSTLDGRPREMLDAARRIAPAAERAGAPLSLAARWMRCAAEILSGDYDVGRRLLDAVEADLRAQPPAWAAMSAALGEVLVYCEECERGHAMLADFVDQARRDGIAQVLPLALVGLADGDFHLGRWTPAYAHATQALSLAETTGQVGDRANALARVAHVEAGLGRTTDSRRHGELALAISEDREIGSMVTLAGSALGLLELGLGRFEAAIERLEPTGRFSLERGLELPGVAPWAEDLAEAYIHVGDPAAVETLATLERQATRSHSRLAHAAVARCRGLLGDDDSFEPEFERALALHQQRPDPFEQARTELCFGQRLRRARRRTEARERLRHALSIFDGLGAKPWCEHVLRELRATGERARRRAPETSDRLTPQELQVALLVADGATNKEAAATLFVSPKTIEAHLLRVYRKLGIRSRAELVRRMLGEQSQAPVGGR
jgi:DNA-binding CsgD family transcriptional regulator